MGNIAVSSDTLSTTTSAVCQHIYILKTTRVIRYILLFYLMTYGPRVITEEPEINTFLPFIFLSYSIPETCVQRIPSPNKAE